MEGYQRPRRRLSCAKLLFFIAVAAGAFGAIAISRSDLFGAKSDRDDTIKSRSSDAPKIDSGGRSTRSYRGPKSGLVHVGAQLLGRIAEVTVKLNDKVEEGELLIRLDDDEARAKLQAAETAAASSKRERDAQPLDKARDELREAEDNVFAAERALTNSRFELEYELQAQRQGNGSAERVAEARRNVTKAKERLQRERSSYASAQAKPDVPAPNRLKLSCRPPVRTFRSPRRCSKRRASARLSPAPSWPFPPRKARWSRRRRTRSLSCSATCRSCA